MSSNFGPPPQGQDPGSHGFPPAGPYGAGQSPYLMPAGLPPGAEYIHDERAPDGVIYFRIYAGVMVVIYALVALFGLFMMFVPLFSPPTSSSGTTELWIVGLLYGGIGIVFFIPWVIALFGGRKPWVHTLGTVMIALGMTQICCLPILIPLLISWTKPETKRWFSAT